MSTLIPHPLAAEQDERINTLFSAVNRSLEALEKLTALNVQAIRFGLAENQEFLGKALAANNVQELLALPALMAPAVAGQVLLYGKQLSEIVAAMQPGGPVPVPGPLKASRPAAPVPPATSVTSVASVATGKRTKKTPESPAADSATSASQGAANGDEAKRAIPFVTARE